MTMKKKPQMKLTLVTPEMAKGWLEISAAWAQNHPEEANRNISPYKVALFSAQMAAEEWQLTSQGIFIGKGGIIIDGQHRLMAIVDSGKAVWLFVLFDESLTSPRNVAVDVDGRARQKHWVLGLPRQDTEAAKLILHFALSPPGTGVFYKHAFSDATLSLLTEFIGTLGYTTKKTRVVSQAPVRAGAVLAWAVNGADAVEQHRCLIARDHANIWPLIASFGTQLSDAALQKKRLSRDELLLRSWKAFSAPPRDRQRSRLIIRSTITLYNHAHDAAWKLIELAGCDLRRPTFPKRRFKKDWLEAAGQLRATGMSYAKVAKELTEKGYQAPRGGTLGGGWCAETVRDALMRK